MNFNGEYRELAMKTECGYNERLLHHTIGLTGELSGELLIYMKSESKAGVPLNKINIMEEVGDACWYLAGLCEVLGKFAGEPWDLNLFDFSDEVYDPLDCIKEACVSAANFEDYVKKYVFYKKPFNDIIVDGVVVEKGVKDDLRRYFDEVVYQLTYLLFQLDISFEETLRRNIAKLAVRYKNGFSGFAANNRDLMAELEALKG